MNKNKTYCQELWSYFRQNLRFEPLLWPCTAEWIPSNAWKHKKMSRFVDVPGCPRFPSSNFHASHFCSVCKSDKCRRSDLDIWSSNYWWAQGQNAHAVLRIFYTVLSGFSIKIYKPVSVAPDFRSRFGKEFCTFSFLDRSHTNNWELDGDIGPSPWPWDLIDLFPVSEELFCPFLAASPSVIQQRKR